MSDQAQDRGPRSVGERSTPSRRTNSGLVCNRLVVFLLLLGLAGLAATAKDGQYRRASNIEHQSSLATKMNVPPTPVVLGSAELQKVARILATVPRTTFRVRLSLEPPATESVGVTVAMQHRSPPESLL